MSKLIANFGCNNNHAMKTNKEYPATHSMSTAWYYADEEGNVAIIDFNANGPIPLSVGKDEGLESIIVEKFAESKHKNQIPKLNLTDTIFLKSKSSILSKRSVRFHKTKRLHSTRL